MAVSSQKAPGVLPANAVQAVVGVGIGMAIGGALLAAASFLDIDLIETGSVSPAVQPPAQEQSVQPSEGSKPTVQPSVSDQPPPVAHPDAAVSLKTERPKPDSTGALTAGELRTAIVSEPTPRTPQGPVTANSQPADVAIAETEADVAQFEITTGMVEPPAETPTEIARLQRADDPGEAAADVPDNSEAQPQVPLPALGAASVNRYVNLRAGPADEAAILVVVPAGAKVEAEQNCEWCVVSYNGQRGYIYKSFLRRQLTSTPGLY